MNAPDVTLLKRLGALAGLILFMVVARFGADALGPELPWYLLHELLVPMGWLLFEVYPKLRAAQRIAFVITSGLFISLSAIAELLAIGPTAWVLPVESFSMYLTGALFPTLCFEWLVPSGEVEATGDPEAA